MRISDWSSDVCSSDLRRTRQAVQMTERPQPESARSVARAPSFASSLPFPGLWRYRRTETTRSSDVDRLEIGRYPTPGARAVADRKSKRLNSSHKCAYRLTSSALKNKRRNTRHKKTITQQ